MQLAVASDLTAILSKTESGKIWLFTEQETKSWLGPELYRECVNRYNEVTNETRTEISAFDVIGLSGNQMLDFIFKPSNSAKLPLLKSKLFCHGVVFFHLILIVDHLRCLQFERHLGVGSYGVVFQVIDERRNAYGQHRYAMKAQKMGLEFEREFTVMSQMASKHVVSLIEGLSGESNDWGWLVQQLSSKGSLATILQQISVDSSLLLRNPIQCWSLARGLIKGVAHLDRRGIVHRDIKASNVLIDSEDGAKLADFGLAKKIEAGDGSEESMVLGESSRSSIVKGARDCWSPELWEWAHSITRSGEPPYSKGSESWAIGILLGRMFVGQNFPAYTGNWKHFQLVFTKEVEELIAKAAGCVAMELPRHVTLACELMKQCLQQRPEQRASVTELLYRLRVTETRSIFVVTVETLGLGNIDDCDRVRKEIRAFKRFDSRLKIGPWDQDARVEAQRLFRVVLLDLWMSIAKAQSLPVPELPDMDRTAITEMVRSKQQLYERATLSMVRIKMEQDEDMRAGGRAALNDTSRAIEARIALNIARFPREAQQLAYCRQCSADIVELFEHAAALKPKFDGLIKRIAADSNLLESCAALKSILRCFEKAALDYASDFSLMTDLLRAKVFPKSLMKMNSVLQSVLDADVREEIRIVKVKVRVERPPLGDCMIKFYFPDDPNRHIGELQVELDLVDRVRDDAGGHDIYTIARSVESRLKATDMVSVEGVAKALSLAAAGFRFCYELYTEQQPGSQAGATSEATEKSELAALCQRVSDLFLSACSALCTLVQQPLAVPSDDTPNQSKLARNGACDAVSRSLEVVSLVPQLATERIFTALIEAICGLAFGGLVIPGSVDREANIKLVGMGVFSPTCVNAAEVIVELLRMHGPACRPLARAGIDVIKKMSKDETNIQLAFLRAGVIQLQSQLPDVPMLLLSEFLSAESLGEALELTAEAAAAGCFDRDLVAHLLDSVCTAVQGQAEPRQKGQKGPLYRPLDAAVVCKSVSSFLKSELAKRDAELAGHALKTLSRLCGVQEFQDPVHDESVSDFVAAGVAEEVVGLLLVHGPSHSGVAHLGLQALDVMATNDGLKTSLGEMGACEAIASSLQAYGACDAGVALWGLSTVVKLSTGYDSANSTRLGNSGACEEVVSCLKAYRVSNAEVVEQALKALANLSVGNTSNCRRLCSAGACVELAACLEYYRLDTECGLENGISLRDGLWAVANLAAGNLVFFGPSGSGGEAGVCAVVVACLKDSPSGVFITAEVAERGLQAVLSLAVCDTCRSRLRLAGVWEAVICCLIDHGESDVKVAELAFRVVVTVADDDYEDDDNIPARWGEPGVCEAVLTCLTVHGASDATVAEWGLRIITMISADEGAVAELEAAGAQVEEIVLECLSEHGESSGAVAEWGLRALSRLLADGDTAARLEAAAEKKVVVACLIAHGASDVVVAECGLRALVSAAAGDDSIGDAEDNVGRLVDAVVLCLAQHGGSEAAVAEWGLRAVVKTCSRHGYDVGYDHDVGYEYDMACRYGDRGACEAVVECLRDEVSSSMEVAEWGLRAMVKLLSAAESNFERFSSAGACEAVVECLAGHGDTYTEVVRWGLRALAKMSLEDDDDSSAEHLRDAGACEAVVACLSAHGVSDADVAEWGLRALVAAAAGIGGLSEEAEESFEVIVACLREHGHTNSTVAEWGMRVLVTCSVGDDDAVNFVEAGALVEVLVCLEEHGCSNAQVAEWGLRSLDSRHLITEDNAIGKLHLGELRFPRAVTACLRENRQSSAVVAKCGLRAIVNLCENCGSDGYALIAARFGEEGVCEEVAGCLALYGDDNMGIAEWGMRAIVSLCQYSGDDDADDDYGDDGDGGDGDHGDGGNAGLFGATGACERVVTILAEHGDSSEEVAEWGLRAMLKLAVLEANFARLCDEGACQAVVVCLAGLAHSSASVAKWVLRAIIVLSDGRSSNRDLLGGLVCDELVVCLQAHGGENEEVAKLGLAVVLNLSTGNSSTIATLADQGICEVVVLFMEAHGTSSVEVAEKSFEAIVLFVQGNSANAKLFGDAGVCGRLVACLQELVGDGGCGGVGGGGGGGWSNATVAQRGLRAMKYLCAGNTLNVDSLGRAGACEVIAKLMRVHSGHQGCMKYAKQAAVRLAAASETNKAKLHAAGVSAEMLAGDCTIC